MTSFYQYHCEVSLVPTPQLCATTVILITSFIVIITTRVSLGSHLFCFHLFQLLLFKSTWICVNLDVYAILGHKCCIFFLWLKAMRLQITTNTSETNNLSVSQRRKITKKDKKQSKRNKHLQVIAKERLVDTYKQLWWRLRSVTWVLLRSWHHKRTNKPTLTHAQRKAPRRDEQSASKGFLKTTRIACLAPVS